MSENKEFESLYLVSEEDLEKINQAEKPFLSYTQIYNSIVKSGEEQEEKREKKLVLSEWLTLEDGARIKKSTVRS